MNVPMPLRYRAALVCAVSALFAGAAWAQIFECTDARGAKQYAQFCPPGTVQQRQVVSRGDEAADAAAGDAAGAKAPAVLDVEFRKRQQERQEAEAKAAQDRAKAEEAERNCTQARAQYKALIEGQRMQRIEPETGARINLGDEERAADAERQRQLVEQWCK